MIAHLPVIDPDGDKCHVIFPTITHSIMSALTVWLSKLIVGGQREALPHVEQCLKVLANLSCLSMAASGTYKFAIEYMKYKGIPLSAEFENAPNDADKNRHRVDDRYQRLSKTNGLAQNGAASGSVGLGSNGNHERAKAEINPYSSLNSKTDFAQSPTNVLLAANQKMLVPENSTLNRLVTNTVHSSSQPQLALDGQQQRKVLPSSNLVTPGQDAIDPFGAFLEGLNFMDMAGLAGFPFADVFGPWPGLATTAPTTSAPSLTTVFGHTNGQLQNPYNTTLTTNGPGSHPTPSINSASPMTNIQHSESPPIGLHVPQNAFGMSSANSSSPPPYQQQQQMPAQQMLMPTTTSFIHNIPQNHDRNQSVQSYMNPTTSRMHSTWQGLQGPK
jgi:hypothetical protein